MSQALTLRICAVDQSGAPYELPVDVEVRHKELASAPMVKQRFPAGAQIDIDGLMRSPQGLYTVLVSPAGEWKPEQQFVTIPASGFATVVVKLQVPGKPRVHGRSFGLPGGGSIPLAPRFATNVEFDQAIDRNPSIPRTFDRARVLARRLFPEPGRPTVSTTGALRNLDECAEMLLGNLLEALRNPDITPADLAALAEEIMAQGIVKTAEQLSPAGQFRLIWFNRAPEDSWEIGTKLEAAADQFRRTFGRGPYGSEAGPIEVHLMDIGRIRGSTTPEGPIFLNTVYLSTAPDRLRLALCAHELFHRVQYSFGFRTRFAATNPYLWFTEGTASWAEQFVSGAVLSDSKSLAYSRVAGVGLFDSSYFSLPFWTFLQQKRGGEAIARFFNEYSGAAAGNAQLALETVADAPLHEFVLEGYDRITSGRVPLVAPDGSAAVAAQAKTALFPAFTFPAATSVRMAAYSPVPITVSSGDGRVLELVISSTSESMEPKIWERRTGGDTFIERSLPVTLEGTSFDSVFSSMTAGSLIVTARFKHDPTLRSVPEIPAQADVPGAPEGFLVRLDEIGNVIIRDFAKDRFTTLGYAISNDLVNGSSFGLETLDVVDSTSNYLFSLVPVSTAVPTPTPPPSGGVAIWVTAGAFVSGGRRNGLELPPIWRRARVEGGILFVQTTFSMKQPGTVLDLHQRTRRDSARLNSDLETECNLDDCDPIVPIALPQDPIEIVTTGEGPGAERRELPLPVRTCWQVSPGWVALRVDLEGEARFATIEQRYCLGGCGAR